MERKNKRKDWNNNVRTGNKKIKQESLRINEIHNKEKELLEQIWLKYSRGVSYIENVIRILEKKSEGEDNVRSDIKVAIKLLDKVLRIPKEVYNLREEYKKLVREEAWIKREFKQIMKEYFEESPRRPRMEPYYRPAAKREARRQIEEGLDKYYGRY